ncbi:potassium-transporting ATPase subunit KdpC [Clavibacter michiganensis]|uniref:Potassium-transporting ATPase KdpC subunit n=1 Tax=Clavibacter michiganensis subsp. insidiosus TaxID=33014 RepID=A0A0D5CKE1_9MICO|nr:potassium-transporting ATPase subunit KdpC [Clavibacter michiganensis]AJW80118.1 potassium transporter KtrA [Clavibacter michiganensis subsp. insidiosus]AWF97223.1 potassium transporter KtrA [Clavibacter michiganensis subsp. insidiosus]AWG02690.1 potassium transporter KtrA [Clavibacter michiganensis subsp. insidiosus]OQJ58886.1 potassium-transporting ATPase subunit C [Clavibacter michiganensis subsp. insidiosus]RII87587.1 potassium-transporting ATPase subunit KdpC [Clavibacter michiganensis
MSSPRQSLRTAGVAVRAMAVLTVVLGVGYTAVVTGIGQLALPARADGSLVSADGQVVGSSLIGQSFQDSDGDALPEWFQSRPSAAGDGYDASASSGSNLGPENDDLVSSIEDREAAIAESDGVDPSTIPADALTASASGLDPHISPEYAREQVTRVAEARGIPEQQVERLVDAHVQGRDLGYLGEPTVNVLELNIALAGLGG